MTEERTNALGEYEGAKKKLSELAMRAGYLLESLRKEAGLLPVKRDFTQIDFNKCAVIVNDLKDAQKQAKEELKTIELLQSTYNFEFD